MVYQIRSSENLWVGEIFRIPTKAFFRKRFFNEVSYIPFVFLLLFVYLVSRASNAVKVWAHLFHKFWFRKFWTSFLGILRRVLGFGFRSKFVQNDDWVFSLLLLYDLLVLNTMCLGVLNKKYFGLISGISRMFSLFGFWVRHWRCVNGVWCSFHVLGLTTFISLYCTVALEACSSPPYYSFYYLKKGLWIIL